MASFLFDEHSSSHPTANDGVSIRDATAATFVADVLEASKTVPVIVDFWAPWCGPCKTLGPLLEKLTRQSRGKVRLVKVNVDENSQLAAQFRIQSIPTVYAFRDGHPVDGFTGGLPESQLKIFFERLKGNANDETVEALAQAKDLRESGQAAEAETIYRRILEQEPDNVEAVSGYLRCCLSLDRTAEALKLLSVLPDDIRKNQEIKAVETQIDLLKQGSEEIAPLQARLHVDANDHQARYDLASAYFAAGRSEPAVEALLEIIARAPDWNEGQARTHLLKMLEALGFSDPVAKKARRKLSALLFS